MKASMVIGTRSLLFLGAGASKPYGKMLMGEFVRSFREGTVFEQNSSDGVPPTRVANPLLDAICEENEDLEFLIEQLDILGSMQKMRT
jgi:hypothetical protein